MGPYQKEKGVVVGSVAVRTPYGIHKYKDTTRAVVHTPYACISKKGGLIYKSNIGITPRQIYTNIPTATKHNPNFSIPKISQNP
jgi:hypothetical protein